MQALLCTLLLGVSELFAVCSELFAEQCTNRQHHMTHTGQEAELNAQHSRLPPASTASALQNQIPKKKPQAPCLVATDVACFPAGSSICVGMLREFGLTRTSKAKRHCFCCQSPDPGTPLLTDGCALAISSHSSSEPGTVTLLAAASRPA